MVEENARRLIPVLDETFLMNRKFIVAILLIAAVPAFAQAQKPRATKDDAQKVVTIISGDKAKIQIYCEIQKLTQQMEQAYEKNDSKTADELSEKIDTLEDTLGPEYAELINGLQDIDPEKDKLGAEIMSMFGELDRQCTR
jgi:peptidoglycan hydrolase CwlO-like protein